MSTPDSPKTSEVLSVLTEQHELLKTLMKRVGGAPDEDRQAAFDDLRHLLVAHEAAEEEVLHPLAREDLGSDDEIVSERLSEEAQAGKAIAALEQLDIGSAKFGTEFAELEKSVIAHAEAEEHEELPAVASRMDAAQQADMVAALSRVSTLANSDELHVDSFDQMLVAAREHFRGAGAA